MYSIFQSLEIKLHTKSLYPPWCQGRERGSWEQSWNMQSCSSCYPVTCCFFLVWWSHSKLLSFKNLYVKLICSLCHKQSPLWVKIRERAKYMGHARPWGHVGSTNFWCSLSECRMMCVFSPALLFSPKSETTPRLYIHLFWKGMALTLFLYTVNWV